MTEHINSQVAASSVELVPSSTRWDNLPVVSGTDAHRRGTRHAVDADTVQRALHLVDATDTESMLAAWRLDDKQRPTGVRRTVSDRAAMAAALILAEEGTPLFVSEFATLFRTRLTPAARRLMGVENVPVMADSQRDERAWYARCWRTVHSIIDPFNAWPAPSRLMSREERAAVIAKRDPEMQAVKSIRAREFTYAWLEMTLQVLPEQYRNAWQGGLSADQTPLRAPSQLKPWRRNHRLPGSPEVPEHRQYIDDNGNTQTIEVPRPVLEIDATPYPRRTTKNIRSSDAAYEMAYAANITLMVTEPGNAQTHPQLIMAASLHQFGRSTAEHTLAGIKSIQERGWNPNQLTADRGYSAGLAPAHFHNPLSQLGVQLITDPSRLGARDASATGGAKAEVGDHWMRDYAHARNASESFNVHLQHARPLQGRMRGLAAQNFVFTIHAAATNLHRIDEFLSDRDAEVGGPSETPRKRKTEELTDYRRRYGASTVIGGQTTLRGNSPTNGA